MGDKVTNYNQIPKIMHLYWGKDKPLSWLRWLTVKTFAMFNPSWQVNVWYPHEPGVPPTWRTMEHNFAAWTGGDWFQRLNEAGPNVKARKANLRDFPPMPEVMRSDLFRWRLLHTIGGFWSDFDIIYYRPMDHLKLDMTADALLCWGEVPDLINWQAIGFLAGKPGAKLFKSMEDIGHKLVQALEGHLKYQDLGTELLTRLAPAGETRAAGSTIGQIPQCAVYPFSRVHTQMAALWEDASILQVSEDTIGVHWFAAQRLSCAKEAAWDGFEKVKQDAHFGGVRWALQQAGFDVGPPPSPLEQPAAIKYSLLMPYYKRSHQLKSTLLSFSKLYAEQRKDYEVIIVNDVKSSMGQGEDFKLKDITDKFKKSINIKIIAGGSEECWNPAPAFQMAASVAEGEYLVLTNPECVHRTDILAELDQEFAQDPSVYVICSCWAIPQMSLGTEDPLPPGQWYQHSQHRNVEVHFCTALSKQIYNRVGGFDVNYAKGMGFDDDDFRNRLKQAGIRFVHRDDLLAVHLSHTGNKPVNYPELHAINKAYYHSVWGDKIIMAEKLPLDRIRDFKPQETSP